jgi:ribosomal protein S20
MTKSVSSLLQTKSQNADILNKETSVLAAMLDRAANNKVIHKNKANRLKSRYAKKIAAYIKQTQESPKTASKNTGTGKTTKSKS